MLRIVMETFHHNITGAGYSQISGKLPNHCAKDFQGFIKEQALVKLDKLKVVKSYQGLVVIFRCQGVFVVLY